MLQTCLLHDVTVLSSSSSLKLVVPTLKHPHQRLVLLPLPRRHTHHLSPHLIVLLLRSGLRRVPLRVGGGRSGQVSPNEEDLGLDTGGRDKFEFRRLVGTRRLRLEVKTDVVRRGPNEGTSCPAAEGKK